MNLDELQSIRDRERQSDSLQQLRETFYEDAGELVGELRAERDQAAARADDPFDAPEVNRLTDDIKTAEQTVEAIYERRVGKLVKMASFAAADMPTEDEGLTVEERELFEHLVEAIEHNRDHVLGVLDGDAGAGSAVPGGLPGSDAEPAEVTGESAADVGTDQQREAPPEPETPLGGSDQESDPSSGSVDAADLMAGDSESGRPTDDAPNPDETSAPDRQAGEQPPPDAADATPDPTPTETAGQGGVPFEATDESPMPAETAGDSQPPEPASPATETESERAHQESGPERESQSNTGGQDEPVTINRETVKITQEVGEIYGVDERSYDLSADDVVMLPAENADPLVERDAAERLE
jgi:DNA replication factor GINS